MDNLKELTKEEHTNAERSLFVKNLIKKRITPYQYYVYLINQLIMYSALETAASKLGVFQDIEEIKREKKIAQDIYELEKTYDFSLIDPLKTTLKYSQYINSIKEDKDKLLAHIYVRHMGDLSGGQIIKRFVPGSGEYYNFSVDTKELKEKLRTKLHDGMAEEAKLCFKMINDFMKELEKYLDMESSD
jgi:heme oxygenase